MNTKQFNIGNLNRISLLLMIFGLIALTNYSLIFPYLAGFSVGLFLWSEIIYIMVKLDEKVKYNER